jgi:selenide,water dikinase
VACSPEAVKQVLAVFAQHGFDAAADIGEITPGGPGAALRMRQA